MRVKTPSRLHFGIIDLSRKFKRKYGALGVTLKDGYDIELESSGKELYVEGSKREKEIVSKVYRKLKEKFSISVGFEVTIEDRIPSHVGLGSTTQLTLGTAYGMLKEIGEDVSIIELAKLLERGRYSAIGTYGFQDGGFILEGGKSGKNEISCLIKRIDFPEDWRFLIICSKVFKGYDEKEEKPIMNKLTVDKKYPEKISHNILMGILPALKRKDIGAFGEHLTRIQETVGKSFSDHQEGIYHPAIIDMVEFLIDNTYGGGQSSWGPTAYGLVKKKEVDNLKDKVLEEKKEDEYRVWIGDPNNEGVIVEE
ncbi:MAG: GHMP kinase [Candidatus Thermoplasmatota archaeon]|nr:GHMP kinase [Candidatus Thermoplasmatota archaeon]